MAPPPYKPTTFFKFYESLLLLKLLTTHINTTTRKYEPLPDQETSDVNAQSKYETFVYKLAHICDSTPGGSTVTSMVILCDQATERVEYRFASNQRSPKELDVTVDYLRFVLGQVASAPHSMIQQGREDPNVLRAVLHRILLFNRQRITAYKKSLLSETQACLTICPTGKNIQQATIVNLNRLLDCLDPGWSSETTDEQYINSCVSLLQCLESIRNSEAAAQIEHLARNGRISGSETLECWAEFRHMMNRLLTYQQAPKFIWRAAHMWPPLFSNFKVTFLRSSQPWDVRIQDKDLSLGAITRRMTYRKDMAKKLEDFVDEQKLYTLEDDLKEQFYSKAFRPIVHSEVLLHDNVRDTPKSSFFHGWMYIGSSKPTCKLCQYYFAESKTAIRCRPSHGNLYINWRLPDRAVANNQTQTEREASQKYEQVMQDRMLQSVRNEVFSIVKKKSLPAYKRHDSITSTARITSKHPDGATTFM